LPKTTVIENLQQFDNALREIAKLDARIGVFDFQRRESIIAAESRFQTEVATMTATRALLADQLEIYYRANRSELEKDGKKSITLQFGCAGIHTGKPTLGLVRGWKWERVLEAIKAAGKKAFLREKQEVDKSAVKKAKLPPEELASLGMKIAAKDEFFFETFPHAAAVTVAEKE
jgi:phage host-nuclease inhibitor protein Gam